MIKKLPNALRSRVDRGKIIDYLLSIEHPDGSSKAKFFLRFGFKVEQWSLMAEALRQHGVQNKVVDMIETCYGTRYVVEGELLSPDKRNPYVRTVWLTENGGVIPRLITAHPV